MRPCYTFTAAAANKPALLSIHEEIGFWGMQAKDFLASLQSVEGPDLTVEINSPGGDVMAATAMYNGLRASGKKITTKVMGVAASAASAIFLAGDKRIMPKNTHLMVHGPSAVAMGNADEMREAGALLDKISAGMRSIYTARTGKSDKEIDTMFAKDTWLNADEALASGFATELSEDIKATAKFDLDRAELPEAVRKVFASAQKTAEEIAAEIEAKRVKDEQDAADAAKAAKDPVTATAINEMAIKAGLTEFAPFLAIACATVDVAKVRIASAREIVAICAFAKQPDQAAAFIKADTKIEDVRAALVTAMAEADVHTNTTKPVPKPGPQGAGTVNPTSLWEAHAKANTRKE